MDESRQSLKKLANIAFVAMCALLIMAILFYRERVLFADAAYIVFSILNEKHLCIQEQRYGSFITQLFPYMGQKLHLPLKAILMAYSASFSIFFLTVNAILVYLFKQYRLAILMAFYYFLFVSASFSWPGNEIHQAVGWLFLLFGVTLRLGSKKVSNAILLPVFLLLAFLAISTHFVVAIPLVFLWVYLIIEKENWPFSKNTTILLSVLLATVAGSFWAFKNFISTGANSYDSVHLHGLTHFSIRDIIDSFTTPVVERFLYRCLVNYWAGVIICIIGIAALAKQNKKLLATWAFLSVTGSVIIMGLTYSDLDAGTGLFHIESEWCCIGIIAATPFIFLFLPEIKPVGAGALVAGIFVVRLVYIISFLVPFTVRINMTAEILAQMRKKGITKLAIYNDDHLMATSKLSWGLPYESVMQSAMNGDKPQLTFILVNPDDKKMLDVLKTQNGFCNPWGMMPTGILNEGYFRIDSTKPYQVMTYTELLK